MSIEQIWNDCICYCIVWFNKRFTKVKLEQFLTILSSKLCKIILCHWVTCKTRASFGENMARLCHSKLPKLFILYVENACFLLHFWDLSGVNKKINTVSSWYLFKRCCYRRAKTALIFEVCYFRATFGVANSTRQNLPKNGPSLPRVFSGLQADLFA